MTHMQSRIWDAYLVRATINACLLTIRTMLSCFLTAHGQVFLISYIHILQKDMPHKMLRRLCHRSSWVPQTSGNCAESFSVFRHLFDRTFELLPKACLCVLHFFEYLGVVGIVSLNQGVE